MSEYYKSLISDDEVIKELVKESKRREGKLPNEVSRLKPNLNFFQRTVTNLVSNNSRIDKYVDTYKEGINVSKRRAPLYRYSPTKKPLIDYAFERQLVLQTKLKFVKSTSEAKPMKVKGNGIYKEPANIRKIIDELSTESDESSSDSDSHNSVKLLNDADRRTSKEHRNYRSNKRKKSIDNSGINYCEGDVVFISSDDDESSAGSAGTPERLKMELKRRKNHQALKSRKYT